MRLPVALLLALTAGCSATVEDGDPSEGDGSLDGTSIQGAVIVDQIVSSNGAKTRVSARFVRVSGGMDQAAAEQVIGAPRFDSGSALGCSELEASEVVHPANGSIELLDAGDLVLHVLDPGPLDLGGPLTIPLAARAFPDLGELVSGIVYTSRDGDEVVPSGGSFLIETTGSAQLDGFTLQIDAPEALSGLSLGSSGLPFGPLGEEEVLVAGDDLVIVWEPGQPALGDRIYVDLATAEGVTLRCVFDDDGHAAIPASLMSQRPDTMMDIEIHRHRRTAAAVDGLDEAVVDFDFAVAARLLMVDQAMVSPLAHPLAHPLAGPVAGGEGAVAVP